ncbi:hemolysin activation protein [Paractinoplanes deccanensis]|uniref:Hemolysin activation protein n=1 Tax=Paractinoplanes deccanensis TaxID=113561 RepID=A0ABQ3Y546_9ACTN|nr:YggT family protein [Actinoplanes deccanensis]GID75124.1 hemolysin activation protein [Actinoplanes deccanensis]
MGAVLAIVSLVLLLMQLLLVARAVLDWSVVLAGPSAPGGLRSRLTSGVFALTEPILAPVRRVIPPIRAGGMSIDLAFIIVFFAIVLLRSFL